MEDAHLTTYLNDHLAACVAQIELARRCLSNNRDTELGRTLDACIAFFEGERQKMKRMLRDLKGTEDLVKQFGGWALEKMGRLKMNNTLFRYSELSRVIEVETLLVGLEADVKMWAALKASRSDDPRFAGVNFTESAEQAESLYKDLERHHLDACKLAFGTKKPAAQSA